MSVPEAPEENFKEDAVTPAKKRSQKIAKIEKLIDHYDTDHDGRFSRMEVRYIVEDLVETESKLGFFKKSTLLVIILLVLSLIGNIGACYAALELAKDTKLSEDGVLTAISDGSAIKTESAGTLYIEAEDEEDEDLEDPPNNSTLDNLTDGGRFLQMQPRGVTGGIEGQDPNWDLFLSDSTYKANTIGWNFWGSIPPQFGLRVSGERIIRMNLCQSGRCERVEIDLRSRGIAMPASGGESPFVFLLIQGVARGSTRDSGAFKYTGQYVLMSKTDYSKEIQSLPASVFRNCRRAKNCLRELSWVKSGVVTELANSQRSLDSQSADWNNKMLEHLGKTPLYVFKRGGYGTKI